MLNAAELLDLVVKDGQPRVLLTVRLPDRSLTAELSSKSVRRAKLAIEQCGVDGVACVLQGKLVADRIEEAGLSAQLKGPKPAAEAVAG